MRRVLKLALPALVLAEVLLVWSGVLGTRDAVLVVAALETLLLVAGVGNLLLVVRRYRRGRGEGLDGWAALEDGLAVVLPKKAARLAVKEPRLFACLFRWAFRRAGLADDEFSYHERSALRAIMPLLAVSAPMELVVVHILAYAFSPWGPLRWVLLALGVYSIFWLLGFYASLATLPHRLEEEGLRLRYGAFAEGFVPYAEIQDVARTDRRATKRGDGLRHAPEEDALSLVVGGKTGIALRLRAPRSLRGFLKESAPASTLHLAADEPDGLARELRRRIEAAASASAAVEHPLLANEKPTEG